jgi:cytoskeleton protein RodZ
MTLLQVAEKLHVDPKVIESIEAENFEPLGATVYVKGHLKRYSELAGEDTQQILDEFAALTKPVMPDLTQLPKAERAADPGKLVVPSLVVLIGLAFVGVVWWILQGVQNGTIGAPAVPRTVETTPAPAESTTDVPRVETASGPDVPSSPPVAVTRRPSGTASTSAAAGASRPPPAGTATGSTEQTNPAEPPRPRTIDLTLRFAADSWVEVYDANGERLFYDIGSASSSRKVSGTPPLRVVLGNAPGVTLDVNGKRARVPANVVTEDSAQFLINSSGRIVRARPPGDGG